MANLSNYLENLLLNWHLTAGAATRPGAWYLALFTAAPSDAGGGTEVSGAGYARKSVTFAAAASGATSNSNAIEFAATGGSFGTVTHWGIFDAASAGNLLWHGALEESKAIGNGEKISFAAGDIDLSMD